MVAGVPTGLQHERETKMSDPKSVAEQVEEITGRWNPAPTDRGLEMVVGVAPEPGDTRATAHVPMTELNEGFNPANDSVDASRPDLYADDGDDDSVDLDDMDKDALKAEAEKRGLAKSGSKDDLRARIREHDENPDGDDEDEDDES